MGKKGFNWKARQIVETKIVESPNSKVKVELGEGSKRGKYDECNALILPSKKRETKKKIDKGPAVTRILSKAQRKKLEKIVERKKKKENRASILEALSKVQAPQEVLSQLTSISAAQTKGHKRRISESIGVNTVDDEDKVIKINAIRGAYKKRRKLLAGEVTDNVKKVPMRPDVFIVGLDSSSEDISEDEEVEGKIDQEDVEKEEQEVKQSNEGKYSDKKIETVESGDDDVIIVNNSTSSIKNETQQTEKSETIKVEVKKEEDNVKEEEVEKRTEPSVGSKPSVYVPVYRLSEIQEARLKLPVTAEEQVIMEAINENPVVIISGETGSGKTTQVPQFLYEAGYALNGKMIGVTEPRRVAAIAMSQRVGRELNLPKDKVSYLIRFEGTVTPKTEIKFMTDGVLLKEIQSDFLLNKYSVIILDEAHERSVYTDVLIGFLSRIVGLRNKRGNPLKLIIMSATLRLEDFTENRRLFKKEPPVIEVESRQYSVKIYFNKHTVDDYVREAYRKACKIHSQLPEGGILIFLTGQQEVNSLVKKLRSTFPMNDKAIKTEKGTEMDNSDKCEDEEIDDSLAKVLQRAKKKEKKSDAVISLPDINLDDYSLSPVDDTEGDMLDDADSESEWQEDPSTVAISTSQPLWVLPLYSLLPTHQQAKVFEKPPEGCRLCVVSTNVAETSLTIPNIKYVIDCGKAKTKFYDKHTGVSAFHVVWTSQASANQRAGRAGRTSDGRCYRLYSSAVFNDEFPKWSVPEMQRRPVDDLVLQLKALGMVRVINFPFPSPPENEQLKAAERRLTLLGALEPTPDKGEWSSTVTQLGKTMSVFPISPRFAKMLCLSHQKEGLLSYTVAIVAALSVQEFLLAGNKEHLIRRRQWAGEHNSLLLGDIMVMLKAIGGAEFANSNGQLEKFCYDNGLRHKAVIETRKLRKQLTLELNIHVPGLDLIVDPRMKPPTDIQARQLRQIMLAGMVDQVARKLDEREIKEAGLRQGKAVYRIPDSEDIVYLKSSCVLVKEKPEWVVYQEIYKTDKMFMRGITAIEPEWLPTFAPTLCKLSDPLTEPPPRYSDETGKLYCHVSATFGMTPRSGTTRWSLLLRQTEQLDPAWYQDMCFHGGMVLGVLVGQSSSTMEIHTLRHIFKGRSGWPLPVTEIEFPSGLECYRWFSVFFLDGSICPILTKYKKSLLSTPTTMIKPWAKLQPRTELLMKALAAHEVDSKIKLLQKWQEDKTYLLNEYTNWLPSSAYNQISSIWPPI